MYLIIDKKTHAILHMSNAMGGQDAKPEDLLPGFDAKTMVFGRAPEPRIPVRFDIEDGVVVDLDAPATAVTAAPAAETLEQARARKRADLTGQALALRAAIVPDYQMLNAGLGLYDTARVAKIKATVDAFRDEVKRIEVLIDKARTVKEIDALVPAFPTAMQGADAAATAAANAAGTAVSTATGKTTGKTTRR